MLPLSRFLAMQARVARVFQDRLADAGHAYLDALTDASHDLATTFTRTAGGDGRTAVNPVQDGLSYSLDFWQRSILFWETLRERGNNWIAHEKAGKPPLLAFPYDIVADARTFAHPCNYALVRIRPPADAPPDPEKRAIVIIDPRAGHGPGIAGFKPESEVGFALKAGHPVYMVIFFPDPMPGQTLADVAAAETRFLRLVAEWHPARGKPVIIGNCQGGWAAMLVAALDPDAVGPVVVNGAPMSYWAGNDAENPMRYAGGVLGGSWPALLSSDLGGGVFDGASLVENFEYLNPANTYFSKYYNLFSHIDTEAGRFLEFERWWGGYFLMNRDEIRWIVENLFVGNRLAAGTAQAAPGVPVDLTSIRSPIILFASLGDNITPPQQAFNWVADVYPTTAALKAAGQVIVGLMHESVGHLGIFVSASVARREHVQILDLLDYVEHLPPGLYGMQITEEEIDGVMRPDVTLVELQVEDLAQLQKYERADEIPFGIVAKLSERNVALYERTVHPVLKALVPPQAGQMTRLLHPLRLSRWSISDLNPALAGLKPLADFVSAHRAPRNEAGPTVAVERFAAAGITAGWDLYRRTRDALVETLFFRTYGTLAAFDPVLATETPPPAAVPARAPAPLAADLTEGGFADAATRVALLAARVNGPRRQLSSLKQVRALVGAEAGLLDLPVEAARAIIQRQAAIVDRAPDAALETLPKLLPDPQDRARLVALVERLADNEALTEEQRALVPGLRALILSATRAPQAGAA